ncbi:MAG: hypothetical protein DME94_03460 [Verrucomicrobia bacterium]|nr:MAG: hypothetical protein DME94_03460 [Verrucomicrobiota bacterium]
MKPLAIPFAITWLVLSGCADPLEQRSTQEVQEQMERGVTGGGKLGPLERYPEDPAAQHSIPETHP